MRRDRGQRVHTAGRVETADGRQPRADPSTVRDDRHGHDPGTQRGGSGNDTALRAALRAALQAGRDGDGLVVGHAASRSLILGGRALSRLLRGPRTSGSSAATGGTRRTRPTPTARPGVPGRGDGRVEVGSKFGVRAIGRPRQRPDDQVGARRQAGQAGAHEMSQPSADLVANDRAPHGLGYHETNPDDRGVGCHDEMHDERTTPGPSATTHRGGELLPPSQPVSGGEHYRDRLTPRGGCAPWPGARRRSRAPHGCACATGSRGSSRGGGCSADRCACSLLDASV